MPDTCVSLLLQHLQAAHAEPSLWLADEHHNGVLPSLANYRDKLQLLSNRFDVAQQADEAGLGCQFSDWQLEDVRAVARVYLRICKEKPVNLHLLRLACNALKDGGELLLAGQKNEGIKTIAKQAEAIFGGQCSIKKHGSAYLAQLPKPAGTGPLDLGEYHRLHDIGHWRSYSLQSKPGVYGWNKIDSGSELLINSMEIYLQQHLPPTSSILDIGCGYGFLSVAAGGVACARRVATDNNAAALLSTAANARANNLEVDVLASDCADTIEGQFDIVLCNPPFHKGFGIEAELTGRFVQAAARKTRKGGTAFFVVNSFIPLEKRAAGVFRTSETLSNNGQFKVVALKH